MLEEIKKGLLAGFGAVLLTKEKIDEVSRKLVNDAKLSKEDAQKLTNELIETGDRRWQDLEKTVTENVRKGSEIQWRTPLTASPLESLLRR
jgi:polyhydroxyalkanoate synthesis regulator phasin